MMFKFGKETSEKEIRKKILNYSKNQIKSKNKASIESKIVWLIFKGK